MIQKFINKKHRFISVNILYYFTLLKIYEAYIICNNMHIKCILNKWIICFFQQYNCNINWDDATLDMIVSTWHPFLVLSVLKNKMLLY